MDLYNKIEALLFWKGEPMTLWDIGVALRAEPDDIKAAFPKLKENLSGRGITVVEHVGKMMLGTAPEMSDFFSALRKEELQKELSKASLETLSIVLYKEGVTRSDINFIRGVNSSYILRNLEVRGLIDRITHKSDSRMYVYKPSLELLAYLGVSSVADLPDFERVKQSLTTKISNQEKDPIDMNPDSDRGHDG